MESIVNRIVNLEWIFFDKVQNIDGRAGCQDDWNTFFSMRSSQLMAWNQAMRESYLEDLKEALRQGRNPLAEKYGYMMERTSPSEYAKIQDQLPPRTAEKAALIDLICSAHVAWLKELSKEYPRLVGQGRPIYRNEDQPWSVSFETYLWGELATYSVSTLLHYARYVDFLRNAGENMNRRILENTVRQYGFPSLDEAEAAAHM